VAAHHLVKAKVLEQVALAKQEKLDLADILDLVKHQDNHQIKEAKASHQVQEYLEDIVKEQAYLVLHLVKNLGAPLE